MNKKVLLISFDFPPRPGIGGNRIFGLAKYLPYFGWEPIVLTGKLPKHTNLDCLVIESNFSDKIDVVKNIFGYPLGKSIYEENGVLKKVNRKRNSFLIRSLNFLKWLILYPDRYSSWYDYAIRDIESLIKDNQIHGIISSLNPIVSHKIAKYVKTKTNILWIADYRDLWSNNHYLDVFPLQRRLMFIYERMIIKKADYLVTVSEPLAKDLSILHHKPVEIILTGYDPEETNICVKSNCFSIIYTGQLLKGRRDPTILFIAINEALAEGIFSKSEISISFYGQFSNWLQQLIISYNLTDCVKQMGFIEKDKVRIMQHEAQLLLLLNWDHESDIGNYTGKIFEYLSAKRPIISIGREESVVSKLINVTETGISSNNLISIKSFLIQKYIEFKETGEVKYNGIENELNKYTQIRMAEQFSNLLNHKN